MTGNDDGYGGIGPPFAQHEPAGPKESLPMRDKSGGPAFPVQLYDFRDWGKHPAPGMSLRDWFAGMALTSKYVEALGEPWGMAYQAYDVADAMLEHRAKPREAHK